MSAVAGAGSAIAFFCAAFYGKNDVIFLHEAGLAAIDLVDLDLDHMRSMQEIYPGVRSIFDEDAFAVARRLSAAGPQYDVVTCDPWFNEALDACLTTSFSDFARIARSTLVVGCTGHALDAHGVGRDATAANAWAARNGHHDVRATELVERNGREDFDGAYWLAFHKI